MKRPTFRNPDKFQVLPFRDWLRENKPPGLAGYVVEDFDLVLRVYGPNYHTDRVGKFMLVELKYGNSRLGKAQKMTFGLIDKLLRKADPNGERYCGYYVVQYSQEDWNNASFRINYQPITNEDFLRFLNIDNDVLSKIPEIEW